jgi:hypothetical protein
MRPLVLALAAVVAACGGDGAAAGDDAATPPGGSDGAADDPAVHQRIAEENALPGTSTWRIEHPAEAREIEGYASRISSGGEPVDVKVSLARAGTFRWFVYRLGFYGGLGGRLVEEGGPADGGPQAEPSYDPSTGLSRADWPTSFTLEPAGWLTGAYLVRLQRDDGFESYVPLIVRDDARDAEVALQHSTGTWAAYNDWGGDSLYVSTHGLDRARKVSSERPFSAALGFGSGLLVGQEAAFVAWVEERGFDVEYTTDLDAGGPAARVGDHRLYLAIGHDEYVSLDQRHQYEAALARGTSFAFLSGNTMPWQVRYEDGGRTMVCYKDHIDEDPLLGVDDARVATLFRDPPVNLPENAFLGVLSHGGAVSEGRDWIVRSPDHWVYGGAGVAEGDAIPGIVGFEWDGLYDNGMAPAELVVLASSVIDPEHPDEPHDATIYERGDAFLFAAGSMYVGAYAGDHPEVTRMLENLFAHAGAMAYATP